MTSIKTLLVDDEYLALNLLEEFSRQVPELSILEKVKSPMRALEILQQQSVDLLFLDIQMPSLAGHQLLKVLPHPPVTVFTTAYSEYAHEAFELHAVDYLLKPFSFERFLQAVHKAKQQLFLRKQSTQLIVPTNSRDYFSIKVDGKIVKVYFRDIRYIEGLKEYVRIVCSNARHVTLESLKNLEELLPEDNFIRVHKSFIVAKDKVDSLNGNLLEVGDQQIPISRSRREEVIDWIFYQ